MRDIFVSYRRTDASDATGRIFDHLKMRFGEERLFKDVDSIPLGSDFRKVIDEAVGSCKVLLAIIGEDWLTCVGKDGTRRIDNPDDFVHLEIAAALRRGIPLIPVLVENAPMPPALELPEPLKDLAFKNAASVRADPDFRNDIGRLLDQISQHVAPSRDKTVGRNALRYGAVALCLMILVAAGVVFFRKGPDSDPVVDSSTNKVQREDENVRLLKEHLVPLELLLQETKGLHAELSDDEYYQTWGILESYVLAVRRDGPAKHALMAKRIDRLVQKDREIVTLLTAYFPHAQTTTFRTESEKMLDHAQRYIDRWEAVENVIKTGDQLPHAAVFPDHFPAALDEEIALRQKGAAGF